MTIGLLSGCAFMTRSSVSSAPPDLEANQASQGTHGVSISETGRFTAFASSATNLIADDTNGVADVFVRDNLTLSTERISVTSSGGQSTGVSRSPSIRNDGRYVAFESTGVDLVAEDTTARSDIFVRDRTLGTATLASVKDDETPIDDPATQPVLSGDGRTVAFQTASQRFFGGEPPATRPIPLGPGCGGSPPAPPI